MSTTTGFYVAIFSTAAVAIGWYGRRFLSSAAEVTSTAAKIPGLKASRNKYRLIVFSVVGGALYILYNLARHRLKV